jgi:hypothetical protein
VIVVIAIAGYAAGAGVRREVATEPIGLEPTPSA